MRRRKAFTLIELLVVVAIIGLLISILFPSLSRARELAKRAVCASNLKGIGQGMYIYSNDNKGWFMAHYFESGDETGGEGSGKQGVVQYVGEMGLRYHERTTSETRSKESHPSRSLFLLIIGGQQTAGSFYCPSSSDQIDDMRNRGAYHTESGGTGNEGAARPGKTRFDFQGYDKLSYSYQLPYGKKGRPHDSMDARMPIVADKGPYFDGDSENSPSVQGCLIDKRSDIPVPTQSSFPGVDQDATGIIGAPNEMWKSYNSVNHNGEGQNILFVDSHVSFERKPIAGVHKDNIYTVATGYEEQLNTLFGEADDRYVPLTNTDSYLVP